MAYLLPSYEYHIYHINMAGHKPSILNPRSEYELYKQSALIEPILP